MKKIFYLLVVALGLASCSSNKCEVIGKVDNFDALGSVYLIDMWDARQVIDSVELVDNTFHFKNIKHAPTFAQAILKSGRPISYLFIEGGKVVVAGDVEAGNVKATGTPANDAFNTLMDRNQELIAKYREAVGAGDTAKAEAIDQEHDAMQSELFEQNKENVFGIFMLQQRSYSESSKVMLEQLAALPKEMQSLPIVARMKDSAERKFKTEPQAEGSDYVPYYINIEQPNLKGEMVSLKSVVEKEGNRYVLLDFWASWCGPCMREVPTLLEAYKLYHKKGFEIYGVSFDASREPWKGAINKHKMGWVNVSTLERFDNPAAKDYAVESIPTNYLIDCSNGVIIAKNLRGEAVLEKLAELLK